MQRDIFEVLDDRFLAAAGAVAIVANGEGVSFSELREAISSWRVRLDTAGVKPGQVVLLKADFGREGIGALFALLQRGNIAILLSPTSFEKAAEFSEIGDAEWDIDTFTQRVAPLEGKGTHALYEQLRSDNDSGIVLFSSGSTGVSKGTVHSARKLLEKFRAPGKTLRTLAFLLFDHIAGIDTLLYSLSNQSTLIISESRTPKAVCQAIEQHKVEVLPTAPSFLNLLLLSNVLGKYDLSSLKIITYGSEMMSEAVLKQLADAMPNVKLIQKYGTSETGALPTQSRSSTSTWLKLGGDGFRWRVREGKFEIRAKTAMLGYLNAVSPFTDDGWFQTGDRVETDGEYVRFLGRDSDIINVGGQKVYPAEVEAEILSMPEIDEVAVFGEKHAILGDAVVAKVRTSTKLSPKELRTMIRAHLTGKIEPYKVPQKLKIVDQPLSTERFKTIRKPDQKS